MANNKTGFSYYAVDTDRYQDIKVKRLKKDCGCAGIAVYDYILCEIYRVKGCFLEWDESTAFDVSEYFGLKENQVKEIVNYCCAVGLFDKELLTCESILTSTSIQIRYIDWSIKAKRKNIKIPEKYLKIPEESRKIMEEYLKIPEGCRKVKKSKVKKEEIKKEENPFSQAVNFIPIEEFRETVLNNSSRNEECRRALRCSPERLQNLIEEFETEQVAKGNGTNTDQEYRKHFINWSKIKIEKNGSEKEFSGSRYKDLT